MEDVFVPLLQTQNLRLRLVDQSVYNQLFSGKFTEEELLTFFGYEEPEKLVEERERFELGLSTFNRTFSWFQLLAKDSEEVIGQAGFHTLFPFHNRGELFYQIKKEENRRKGLITEALSSIIPYGFINLWINRMEALTSPNNEASQAVLKKFGFQFEGLLKEHYRVGEVLEDSLQFSLLRKSWESEILL
jgi:ribosomal-protein-alanine N-acetyltransferase